MLDLVTVLMCSEAKSLCPNLKMMGAPNENHNIMFLCRNKSYILFD